LKENTMSSHEAHKARAGTELVVLLPQSADRAQKQATDATS